MKEENHKERRRKKTIPYTFGKSQKRYLFLLTDHQKTNWEKGLFGNSSRREKEADLEEST